MKVHIFRGEGRVFGFTPSESSEPLPPSYGPWTAFKIVDVDKGSVQPGMNVDQCLSDIEQYGFHLTDAHVRIPPQGR